MGATEDIEDLLDKQWGAERKAIGARRTPPRHDDNSWEATIGEDLKDAMELVRKKTNSTAPAPTEKL
ncbi:MAG: hypothetical protein ABII07_03770 [Patescibacteria group bacterium]|nr:hypothetical protein [Patescibacteria group bacterium]